MSDPSPSLRLKACYVFPIDAPPVADGIVTIRDGRIERVGAACEGGDVLDLGNVALLPGLVNAHTHLEASDLAAPLGAAGMALVDWIRHVIGHRALPAFDPQAAIAAGLAECVRFGTTLVGEIAVAPWTTATADSAAIDSVVFLELMGLSDEAVRQQRQLATAYLHDLIDSPPHPRPLSHGWERGERTPLPPVPLPRRREGSISPGLSPHAPYTAGLELVSGAVGLADRAGVPLAMHLAESPDEIEFLRSGGGPFRKLLEDRGKWRPEGVRPGTRPLDYMRLLAGAPRSLVVHGNFLDDEEIALLAAHQDRMAVVYCPRTHAYFGHPRHPLSRLLAAGAKVCLGTDSRASNPDLSLLAELRFVARHFPELPPERILKLGTCDGAWALGCEHCAGTITAGKPADLAAVALPDRHDSDPHALLLDSDLPVVGTWIRGRRLA